MLLDEVIIESSGIKKYNPERLSSSLRLNTEPLESSQNIQIISSSMIKDQFSLNVNENITRNVSGSFREELHNGISADIYSRGGYMNAQRNGVDLRPLLKGPLGDDISIIESIEFIKGPSGFMNSLGDPAGTYNVVTKKPTGQNRSSYTVMYGSYDMVRAEADIEGVLDNEGRLSARLNMMGMYKEGFLQFDTNDRILIAPSFLYKLNNSTTITAQYVYQRMNYMMLSEAQISPYGFGSLPIDFSITDPSTRPYRGNEHNAFITLEKEFNKNWKFTAQVSDINCNSKGTIFWVYGPNEENIDILDRYLVYDAMKYNVFSAQAFINGSFNISGVKNNIIIGVDYNNKHNQTADTWETASNIYPLEISNPIYSQVINNNFLPNGDFNSENTIDDEINLTDSKLYYISGYIMDEINLFNERVKLNIGVRATRSKADFIQYGDKTKATNNVITPRAGINWLFTKSASIYALYDNTFIPQAGSAIDGTALKPLKGRSFEAGLKNEWFGKALSTTLSVYNIRRSNNIVNDPVTNDFYQTGENESKGFEADIRGTLFKGLNVVINYAYTDSKITKDDMNPEMVGKATPNRIRHIQNSWIDYSLPGKVLKGLSVSAGYQYLVGRTERFTSSDPQKMDDIFRIDAGISYSRRRYKINLMVNNLLDAKQYSTAWKRNDMYYWVQLAPLTYRCSITLNL